MTSRIIKHYLFILAGVIYFLFYIYYSQEITIILQEYIYGQMVFSYISAVIAVFTSYSVLSIILRSTRHFAKKLGERKESAIYPILSGGLLKFMKYTNYIVSVYFGFTIMIIPKEYNFIVNKIVSTIFILITLLVLSNLIISIFENRGLFQFKFSNNLSKHLSSIIKKVLLVFIWIIGGITIVSHLGYDISALITGAGIGGIALALGAQKSLTNVFGAISIVLNKPFRIGDFIKIDSTEGTVKDIGLSYITLTELSGHQVMIPNEIIMSCFIQNYSIRESRKGEIEVQLVCDLSQKELEKAIELIEGVFDVFQQDNTLSKYTVFFNKFGGSSYDVLIRYFSYKFDYNDFLIQRGQMHLEIKRALKKAKIDVAIPVQSVILEKT